VKNRKLEKKIGDSPTTMSNSPASIIGLAAKRMASFHASSDLEFENSLPKVIFNEAGLVS
jgi:hypothetical protein